MALTQEQIAKLAADLEAEFTKPKKAAKPKEPTDTDVRKERNKAFHEKLVARDPLEGSSAIAKSWQQRPGWVATKRVAHVHLQFCRFCNSKVEFVGNELVVFENKRLRAQVQSAELVTHDKYGRELEILIEEHVQEVDFCVSCLRLAHKVSDLLAICEINGSHYQLPLQIKAAEAQLNIVKELEL